MNTTNVKDLFRWAAWITPIITIIVVLVMFKIKGSGEPSKSNTVIGQSLQPVSKISEIITITKEESETIQLKRKDGIELDFEVRPTQKDTPFICHYNGGEGVKGGWDEFIPAYEDWERLNWKPKINNVGLETVSFSLDDSARMNSAKIKCAIIPKK